MRCEGTTPERTETIEVEERTDTGTRMVARTRTVPAGPCKQRATILARSMREAVCNLGGVHWVTTEDRRYCVACYVPGRMEHLDGRVTQHAPMAVE